MCPGLQGLCNSGVQGLKGVRATHLNHGLVPKVFVSSVCLDFRTLGVFLAVFMLLRSRVKTAAVTILPQTSPPQLILNRLAIVAVQGRQKHRARLPASRASATCLVPAAGIHVCVLLSSLCRLVAMPCFGSKRVDVVPCIEDDVPGNAAMGRPASGLRNGAGRIEAPVDTKQDAGPNTGRDGLHSAPNGRDTAGVMGTRAAGRDGLHSAPQRTPPSKGSTVPHGAKPNEPLGDFLIEAAGDGAPNAAAVDAYLEDVLGPRVVKDLRNTEWASRVQGLEAIQQLVMKKAALSGVTPTGQSADSSSFDGERASLFRACITVLARSLQDKGAPRLLARNPAELSCASQRVTRAREALGWSSVVVLTDIVRFLAVLAVVPVYLPALSLLASIYSPSFLQPIAGSQLPRAAISHFAHQLIFRSGSSNVRAREESSNAMIHLARCEAVGCALIAPWILKPISNTKQAHAVVGRLELLRTLVAEFSLGSDSGLEVSEVLAFTLPLCEAASGNARDAAVGLVLDVRATEPARIEDLIENIRPSVLALIKARLAPPDAKAISGLSVSGRKLPPIGTSVAVGDSGDEVSTFQGTPPGHEARNRARQTSTELGARSPPMASKKAVKPKGKSSRSAQEASLGTLHYEQTEEERLMAEILEDTK